MPQLLKNCVKGGTCAQKQLFSKKHLILCVFPYSKAFVDFFHLFLGLDQLDDLLGPRITPGTGCGISPISISRVPFLLNLFAHYFGVEQDGVLQVN